MRDFLDQRCGCFLRSIFCLIGQKILAGPLEKMQSFFCLLRFYSLKVVFFVFFRMSNHLEGKAWQIAGDDWDWVTFLKR